MQKENQRIESDSIKRESIEDHFVVLTESQMNAIEEESNFGALNTTEGPAYIPEELIYDLWIRDCA